MSAKPIYEFDGKHLINFWLPRCNQPADNKVKIPLPWLPSTELCFLNFNDQPESEKADIDTLAKKIFADAQKQHPWLLTTKLVVKPDQLIKRRGKNGLLGIKLDWDGVKQWVLERALKSFKLEKTEGILHTFLVEPFCAHEQDEEFYIAINSTREGDNILFTHEGGVDVGDVDSKARKIVVPINAPNGVIPNEAILSLVADVTDARKKGALVDFIQRLYWVYTELQFTYLEINPLVLTNNVKSDPSLIQVYALDLAAKLDQTADFECGKLWSTALSTAYPNNAYPSISFPAQFGRSLTKEEAYIADLDAKTGASLKLTVLNPKGRIWTLVAGGGASVVYADAISALGYADELANYGEYSGAPSESQTYAYSKTVFDLLTRYESDQEKFLFIGGAIANFTNVADTFKGIILALKEFKDAFIKHKVKIFVRRAGPNYQEGLRLMKVASEELGLDIKVFGPEMHVSGIVPLALKPEAVPESVKKIAQSTQDHGKSIFKKSDESSDINAESSLLPRPKDFGKSDLPKSIVPFTSSTKSFIYGMQPRAIQGMLDFDFMCQREEPSVCAMIYPFGGSQVQKFYWGTKEILIPVFKSVKDAVEKFTSVDTIINFASFRSVYESTLDILTFSQIKTIAIIAEGVPERRARQILYFAKEKGVTIIGPATVGGIKPGCFKIGNTGGMMDNIIASKLYRPGSVAYVSKSGGMSNELNNVVSRTTDGVYEGIAIGGDRYPGSTFIDHMLRYQADPNAKILLLLGEVGGVEEYRIIDAIKSGQITKPIVAWCIGTCSGMFKTDVQFGHAGSFADSIRETAEAKNKALKEAGCYVPDTFELLPNVLQTVFDKLVNEKVITIYREPPEPKIPIDYSWAKELGLIRKPASFISTICDDRGQELLYAGTPISNVFDDNLGVGGVISLLWFKKKLPKYATDFIEMVLMLTADHGPAVSGAHNTIVTARAGKDLISSLASGLLTIGERFGGALDGAARDFSAAYDAGLAPQDFVSNMRKAHKLILGIGHKIKSRTNPDYRVELVKNYVFREFPSAPLLSYALEVEKITTSKKDNLILNVDGAVGTAFVDLLKSTGEFTAEEVDEYIRIGVLNGLFVLGRSIGFIGHFLDQKRLKQGLYRHPWDDISYL